MYLAKSFGYYHRYVFHCYFQNKRKITIKEIAEAKMGSIGFYIDIISVFPVYIFTDTIDPNGVSVTGQIALLFPILQVWHIWNYMEKWKNNLKSHHKVFIYRWCLRSLFVLLFNCRHHHHNHHHHCHPLLDTGLS